VTLQLFTPLGDITVGSPAKFSARVNALAGLGQLFTGIALLLLLSWWIHHLRREHRRRQFDNDDSVGRHPAGERSA
jgi:flagellar biogenesis protein FliO